MSTDKVLIVGGGPTSLVLAMVLKHHNVPFRLISAASGPGTLSRAMGVHARTLELYEPFGLTNRAVDEGVPTRDVFIRIGDAAGKLRERGHLSLSQMGQGLSAYPYMLQYPQDKHERLLVDKLTELGVTIEWNTKLESLQPIASGATVHISGPKGDEKRTFEYVCGADGAHSKVRHSIGIGFTGGTYEQQFFVADVHLASAFRDSFTANLDAKSLCLQMPLPSGTTRLVGMVPPGLADKPDLNFDDVREGAERLSGTRVAEVNWFSPYHVSHRVADHYRAGNIFLAGDACHIHSPLGGQGMNTGIGDAFNLGWKLASVINGKLSSEILDTYEPERRAFAATLVYTNDRVFSFLIEDSWLGWFMRQYIWPIFIFLIGTFDFMKLQAFKTMSQTKLSYPPSKLAVGSAGAIKAGERLPWVNYGANKDNFDVLDGVSWSIHVYGDAKVDLHGLEWIPVRRFKYDLPAKQAGLRENAVYLLRPDGYIGLAMDHYDPEKIRNYVAQLQLRP